MPHPPQNLAASVRQRLLDLARSRNEDFGLILVKYGLERILYRLSRSKHRDTFVLKGALLFELWIKHTYRATRDADFLAHGDNSPERFVGIFKELCVIEVEPMVKLGIANSRMKDFYDLEVLSRNLDFDGKMLGEAIRKTFERRGTELPAGGTPVAFTSEFYNDTNKKKQWAAFGTRNATYVTKTELKEVVENIGYFLTPVARALLDGVPFTKRWESGRHWH